MNKAKKPWLYAVLICVVWLGSCNVILEFFGIAPDEDGKEKPESPDSEDETFIPSSNLLSFYVSGTGIDTNDGLFVATPFKTLARAYEAALADSTHKRIVILSDLVGQGSITLDPTDKKLSGDKAVLIEGNTANLKIERSDGANDSCLVIKGGAKVTFKNILINGKIASDDGTSGNANNRALAVSGSGTVVALEKDTVITGKKYASSTTSDFEQHGSGILVSGGGKLVMKEGSVTSCTGIEKCGGAVMVLSGGIFEMNGAAAIHGNRNYDYGGGVAVYGGTFTMNGGIISANELAITSRPYGNGICLREKSSFTMNGGEISGNNLAGAESHGGGVYSHDSTFTMNGGEISRNMVSGTDSKGGGIYIVQNSTFTITGGTVYGSDAADAFKRNTASSGAAFYGSVTKHWLDGSRSDVTLNTMETTLTMP